MTLWVQETRSKRGHWLTVRTDTATEMLKTIVGMCAMFWSWEVLMCYVNIHPRTVPFGTRPLKSNTYTIRGLCTSIASGSTFCRDCFISTTRVCERFSPDSRKSVVRASTCALTELMPLSQIVQIRLLGDFSRRHRIKHVRLLVENQHHRIARLIFVWHFGEFFVCLLNRVLSTA